MTDYLAQTQSEGQYVPEELFAGESDVVTEGGYTVASGQNLARFTVVGVVTASGKLKKHDPAAADGTQKAYGILMHACDASAADVTGQGVYRAGVFNRAALTFDATITTLAAARAAFAGTPIFINDLG